ncbi:hypothetical protein NLU14_22195, partial [Marinobacter sp. 71-i]
VFVPSATFSPVAGAAVPIDSPDAATVVCGADAVFGQVTVIVNVSFEAPDTTAVYVPEPRFAMRLVNAFAPLAPYTPAVSSKKKPDTA